MTRRTLLLSAALLSLAAPGALGTWRTADSMEPDTSHDVAGDRMWRDPPPAAGRGRVYFEATLAAGHEANPMGVRANPNAGALGTRVMPGGTLQAFATLGVWSDCDGDGFVGAALGQVTEYRVELLDDPSACPARHVRNGTVYELLWILPPGSLSRAPHLADADAAVWGDFGRPGDRPHLPCALTPLPAGAAARTGGLLVALDCHAGFTVTQALDEADPGGRQGIGFDDPYHPERDCDHALNRPLLLGRDPNRCAGEPRGALDRAPDDPAVGVFDCGARTPVRDPTAPEGERGALSEGVHAEQPLPVSPRRVDLDVSDEEGTYAWLPAVSPRVDRVDRALAV
ncbi:MAG TPA: hypothetical protein VHH36_03585, partial [Candidatus Thermoplasmatota archaeon]|nr:hypothetical protein [Candidatus Thermoplasmatota archaeon]